MACSAPVAQLRFLHFIYIAIGAGRFHEVPLAGGGQIGAWVVGEQAFLFATVWRYRQVRFPDPHASACPRHGTPAYNLHERGRCSESRHHAPTIHTPFQEYPA